MFFLFVSSFLLATITPEETKHEPPPTPPNGTVASKPMTEIAEPKLTLQNTAERTLEPAALQLTIFLPVCSFWQQGDSG